MFKDELVHYVGKNEESNTRKRSQFCSAGCAYVALVDTQWRRH